jgi:hypothetical protein
MNALMTMFDYHCFRADDISVLVDTIVVDQPNDTFRIYLPINYNLVDTDQRPETPLVPLCCLIVGIGSGTRNGYWCFEHEGKTLSDLNFDDPYLTSDVLTSFLFFEPSRI